MENSSQILSPELYGLLKEYFKSDDIVEDPNFDVIAYLNERFPDFESLDKLPNFISQWEKEFYEIDEELDSLMIERTKYSEEMKTHMGELNEDVKKIVDLINSIKKSADINETTVKSICNDIKNLDNARNNITTTISSLTKLQLLIKGIENLEISVKSKDYKDASNQIEACNAILEYFEEYKHITQINQLQTKKENLCSSLTASIIQEFKNNINQLPANEDTLFYACCAMNAIGGKGLNDLKSWFARYKMMNYEELFDPKKTEDRIELCDTERRFEWLKRVLREFNLKYELVFPPSWGMKHYICQEFLRITKLHLNELLESSMDEQQKKLKIDVDVLVKVLNITIGFENGINNLLNSEYEIIVNLLEELKSGISGGENSNTSEISNYNKNFLNKSSITTNSNNKDTIDEIRARYDDSTNSPYSQFFKKRTDPNKSVIFSLFRIKGVVSECFEQYMNSYVKIEEKKLIDLINNNKMADKIEGKLWTSTMLLFRDIQQAINRCLSFSRNITFYDLTTSFNQVFKFYNNNVLLGKTHKYTSYSSIKNLCDSINSNSVNNSVQIKNEEKILALRRLEDDDIKFLCIIINSSDHCIETVGSLTNLIVNKIDEQFKQNVNFDESIDVLKTSSKASLDILSIYLKVILMENLKVIPTSVWIDNDVSNISLYCSKIREKLFTFVKIIKVNLNDNFCVFILNTIPKLIKDTFLNYFYRIKKLDESGSQQLLMDVFDLKSMCTELFKEYSSKNAIEGDFTYDK